jgi:hypothetical protein
MKVLVDDDVARTEESGRIGYAAIVIVVEIVVGVWCSAIVLTFGENPRAVRAAVTGWDVNTHLVRHRGSHIVKTVYSVFVGHGVLTGRAVVVPKMHRCVGNSCFASFVNARVVCIEEHVVANRKACV